MDSTTIIKEEISNRLLCMACLCVGRSLQEIKNDKMKEYYLDALKEIPLSLPPQTSPLVCWECTAQLKKALLFREQVKDSYRILQTYTSEDLNECLLSDITRPPRLMMTKTRTESYSDVTTINTEEAKQRETEYEYVEKPDIQHVSVKNEVKQEWDVVLFDENKRSPIDDTPMSGSDNDKGLEEDLETLIQTLKKDKKKKKKKLLENKNKKVKIRKSLNVTKKKQQKKEDKKILKIELSYDDMLLEREKESTREGYMNAKYKCQSCLIAFNFLKSYEAHVTAKHSPKLGKYCCPICKTIIPSVDSFTAHYKRHMRRYECSICQKRTMDMKVMQQHYYSTHEISLRQYKCSLCGKLSNSIDAHRYHKDSHKQRLQCPQCDKTFRHRAALMNHRLTLHEFQNNFPCTLCDKVFRWKTSLSRHLEKHDTKSKDPALSAAYCSMCSISFSSICSYRRHMKNSLKHVTPEQLKYICDHCNRRFADKTKIRDHIEEKHLHKTYHCHICLKPSKNRVGLDQHIRNVHKGRPNNKMCHHCGKGFPTKMQLESHIRTHTGERPFICEYCPTTFTQQSNLYKHNRQVHLNIKSKRYPICKKRKEDGIQTETPVEQEPAPAPAPAEYPVAILHYSPERGFVM